MLPLEEAWQALREVLDPELGINVVDLGLVYALQITDAQVRVQLTMTTAACPLGDEIVHEAEARLRDLPWVKGAQIALVWEPAWTPERMSPAAKKMLGWG